VNRAIWIQMMKSQRVNRTIWIQIMKSQRVNRNHIDQDSDHQESRVNSVKSSRGKKLGALVGDKDIPLENGGGTFNPGQFDFFDFFFSRELCKPNIERLRVPDLNQPANTDKQQR